MHFTNLKKKKKKVQLLYLLHQRVLEAMHQSHRQSYIWPMLVSAVINKLLLDASFIHIMS